MQGAPEVARALRGAAKLLWNRRHDIARPATARPAAIVGEGADRSVVVPGITDYVDLDDWDARANPSGGNSHSKLAGFAAKLGERLERRRTDDGTVTLLAPISDRTEADTRAIAMSYVRACIDPTQVTTNLSGVRDAFRQGVKTVRDAPDQTGQLLALTPFVPRRVVKLAADLLFGFGCRPDQHGEFRERRHGDLAVVCSNLGDVDPAVARPDGTDAEYVMLRGVDQNVTRQYIESLGGQLVVNGARIVGKMSISVIGYLRGGE